MKHEREARVFYCFQVFGSPDDTRETSCLHNISNENISLAVQFIKRERGTYESNLFLSL